MSYIVVFEYTEVAGEYRGCRYWTLFDSKEEFELQDPSDDILPIGEGITEEEAISLCLQASIGSMIRAVQAESTNPSTGRVDEKILDINIRQLAWVLATPPHRAARF